MTQNPSQPVDPDFERQKNAFIQGFAPAGQGGKPTPRVDKPASRRPKSGDLSKCGRCQAYPLGAFSAEVRNAPPGIFRSWCHDCIIKVNNGARPILYGVSIDATGQIIRDPYRPPETLAEHVQQVFGVILGISVVEVIATLLLLVLTVTENEYNRNMTETQAVINVTLCSVSLLRHAAVFVALWFWKSQRSLRAARLAAWLAALPLCAFCWLAVPIGLYTIGTLNRADIKSL